MRQNLQDTRKAQQTRDAIRAIRGNIETIFWMLRNMNTSAASGTGDGTGTSFSVEVVESLPAIPTVAYKMVFWTSAGAGTGDDQTWEAFPGQTRWYPCQKPTTLSGAPGA
jgi:hypothetical protein